MSASIRGSCQDGAADCVSPGGDRSALRRYARHKETDVKKINLHSPALQAVSDYMSSPAVKAAAAYSESMRPLIATVEQLNRAAEPALTIAGKLAGSPVMAAIAAQTRTVAAAVRPLAEAAEHARHIMEPVVRVAESFGGILGEIHKSMRPVFALGWVDAVTRSFRAFDEALESAESMGRFGWTVPLNVGLHQCVALLRAATDAESIDAAFLEFYGADAGARRAELLADLTDRPELLDWLASLEEIAFALDAGKYRIAVPALLATFEGVAIARLSPRFWRSDGRKAFFDERLALHEAGSFDAVMWRALRAFVDELYQGAFEERPRALNRNWIMHGRGPAEASLADCLRLLQAIETALILSRDEPNEEGARAAGALTLSPA